MRLTYKHYTHQNLTVPGVEGDVHVKVIVDLSLLLVCVTCKIIVVIKFQYEQQTSLTSCIMHKISIIVCLQLCVTHRSLRRCSTSQMLRTTGCVEGTNCGGRSFSAGLYQETSEITRASKHYCKNKGSSNRFSKSIGIC